MMHPGICGFVRNTSIFYISINGVVSRHLKRNVPLDCVVLLVYNLLQIHFKVQTCKKQFSVKKLFYKKILAEFNCLTLPLMSGILLCD